MKFSVQGQYSVELFINGQAFALSGSNFRTISVVQNAICLLPTFKIMLLDLTGKLIDQYSIKDGTVINLNIGNNDLVKKMVFRVYGTPSSTPGPSGPEIKLVGYLDAPKYFMRVVDPGDYTDTSSNIIKRIADYCGLTTDIDTTSDKMTWIPGRNTYGMFARQLSYHAYSSNTSAFGIGVDLDKKLHYKDLTKLLVNKPTKKLYYGAPSGNSKLPSYNCLAYNIKTISGILNKWAGYGMSVNQEQLNGTFTENKSVQATRLSNFMEMDSDLKKQIDTARIEYFPPDCGNVHSNYAVAYHQNRRIKSTFSTLVEILTDRYTGLNLFDVTQWQFTNQSDRSINSAYNGSYLLAASALMVTSQQYYEKHRLISTGRQTDKSGTMV